MRTFRRETLLYILALALGLAVRLIQLGTLPLTDLEAKWALQALGVAQGTGPALGGPNAIAAMSGTMSGTKVARK